MNAEDHPTPPPLPNSYWVLPGRLLAGEHPSAGAESDLPHRLERLHLAGIGCYLDLTEEGELPEYRHRLPAHVEYRRSPILDTAIPLNTSQTAELIGHLRAALAAQRGVYVHCRAGIGRTGLLIGCFLAEEEASGKRALKRLNRLWQQSARAAFWPKVPQTPEQAAYVRDWLWLRGLSSSAGR